MKFLKERRAQGAFEYILLLAGVLLIVVLAIIILRGSVLGAANNQIQSGIGAVGNASSACNGTHTTLNNGSGIFCCDKTTRINCYNIPIT